MDGVQSQRRKIVPAIKRLHVNAFRGAGQEFLLNRPTFEFLLYGSTPIFISC